jgi:hypothetical protein
MISHSRESTVAARIYVVDGRIYQVVVTALSTSFDYDQAHKFPDSFRLAQAPVKSR